MIVDLLYSYELGKSNIICSNRHFGIKKATTGCKFLQIKHTDSFIKTDT